jgi:hypothetical protein
MEKLIILVCLILACGCVSQQVTPSTRSNSTTAAPTTTPVTVPTRSGVPEALTAGAVPTGENVHPITIYGRAPSKAWPGVPAKCVFTGIVLVYDRFSIPHQVLLENMCLQKLGEDRNLYEGEHLWVKADGQGRYKLPFQNAHLEERDAYNPTRRWRRQKRLVFVTEFDGHRIEESLVSGNYEPGTLSFENSLNAYRVRTIKN